VVISGTRDGLLKCISHLRTFSGHDPRPVKLNVSAPFHTSILQPAVGAVHDALSTMHLSLPAKIPVISNVTAREFPDDPKQLKILVEQQTVRRVRWYESVEYLHEHCGVQRWLGIGPGNVSRNLIGRELGMEKVWGLSSVGELDGVLEMLASDILTKDQDPQEGATS
jgi:[acyl-carrier-protein] S-malonyltransferase